MGVLRDAADPKQQHTAKAAADGLLSAELARDGFTGAQRIPRKSQPSPEEMPFVGQAADS